MRNSCVSAFFLAALMVASCGQSTPPEGASVAVDGPPKPQMPAFSDWLTPLNGKTLAEVAPKTTTDCNGVVDGLNIAYADGARVIGWAWNKTAKAPYSQFLVVDPAGVIRGGGVGGMERPDVPAALPNDVTATAVGFTVDTTIANGTITVHAFDAATKSACKIGEKTY